MMLELVLAYLFAAGMGVTVVYLAKQNRKRGWHRPAQKWFGVELEARDDVDSGELLLPALLQLNRELGAHRTSAKPEVASQRVDSADTQELAALRKL